MVLDGLSKLSMGETIFSSFDSFSRHMKRDALTKLSNVQANIAMLNWPEDWWRNI